MPNQRRNLLIGLIALTWLIGMVLVYFVNHKPFGVELLLSLGSAAWRMLLVAALCLLAGGIGLRLVRLADMHPFTRLALQAGLGFGVMALCLLGIGSFALPAWLPGVLLIGLGLLFLRPALEWARQWNAIKTAWSESDGFGRAIGWISAALLVCALLTALAPPVKYDALMYHLTLPQAYLRDGRISDLAWNIFSGMPQNTEMLYTWAVALGGGQAAAALGWAFAGLALAGAWGWLRQTWGARPAWVGIAALAAGGSLIRVAADAYTDWLGILFALGCVVMIDRYEKTEQRPALLLAGCFAGLALGTKYTSGLLALSGLAALAFILLRRRRLSLWPVLLFGLMVTAAFLPWLVKNLLWTGNPAYPFLFPAGAMTQLRLDGYQNTPPSGDWQDVLLLPVRATMLGVEGAGTYGAAIGALLLGFSALAWLGSAERSAEQRAQVGWNAMLVISGWLFWAVASRLSGSLQQTRYAFALFPALLPLVAAGYQGLCGMRLGSLRLKRISAAIILLALGANLVDTGIHTLRQGAAQHLLGIQSDAEYQTLNLGWYQVALETMQNLPEGSRVLMLYEARGYYCAPRCSADEILDRWRRDATEYESDEQILSAWQTEGYTHLLMFTSGVEFLRGAQDPHHPPFFFDRLDQFLLLLPEPQRFGNDYALYSLRSANN